MNSPSEHLIVVGVDGSPASLQALGARPSEANRVRRHRRDGLDGARALRLADAHGPRNSTSRPRTGCTTSSEPRCPKTNSRASTCAPPAAILPRYSSTTPRQPSCSWSTTGARARSHKPSSAPPPATASTTPPAQSSWFANSKRVRPTQPSRDSSSSTSQWAVARGLSPATGQPRRTTSCGWPESPRTSRCTADRCGEPRRLR